MATCKDCVSEGVPTKRPAPHPGPRCASHHRAKRKAVKDRAWEIRLDDRYGITPAEYKLIFEFQNGCCYICQRAKGISRKLCVDHDHVTGLVRGLLCMACNKNILGHLRDDIDALRRAIDYLENPPAAQCGMDVVVPA